MRHLNRSGSRSRGLSLIEVMVGLAISAVLLVNAAPFFGDLFINSRLREGGHVLLADAMFAQSEAIKRNGLVRLTVSGAAIEVSDRADPANPQVLRSSALAEGLVAPTTRIDFGSEGRPTPFGTAVAINLGSAGAECSTSTRCPGLRVDAGGAVRLCGNHLSSCP